LICRLNKYHTNADGIVVGDGFRVILDEKNQFGLEEIEAAFMCGPGVDPALVPKGWIENHYQLVVWKLACHERSFPHRLAGIALTPHQVMLQLKYRYDREVIIIIIMRFTLSLKNVRKKLAFLLVELCHTTWLLCGNFGHSYILILRVNPIVKSTHVKPKNVICNNVRMNINVKYW